MWSFNRAENTKSIVVTYYTTQRNGLQILLFSPQFDSWCNLFSLLLIQSISQQPTRHSSFHRTVHIRLCSNLFARNSAFLVIVQQSLDTIRSSVVYSQNVTYLKLLRWTIVLFSAIRIIINPLEDSSAVMWLVLQREILLVLEYLTWELYSAEWLL